MKARKILVSLAALALVAAISIGGTLAYLTSTQSVKNTFTVGNVNISLTEAQVDENGDKVLENDEEVRREIGNAYHLLPGHAYVKDPTVSILAGSEEAYVRMLVTVTFDKVLTGNEVDLGTLNTIFTGRDPEKWILNGSPAQETKENDAGDKYTVLTFEYRYFKTVENKTAEDEDLEPLFTQVKIPDTWDGDTLAAIGGFTIDIEAQAIQADGFEAKEGKTAADVAWDNFPTTPTT